VDLPTAAEQPLTPVQDAAVPLQMGRNTAYRLIASGGFPIEVLKIGKRYMVRTSDLRRYLGLDSPA